MAIKESKEYYTAAQTKKILGITDGMLYNYIDNGALERVIPPGRKQGVYRIEDVEKLARELQTFIIQRKQLHSKLEKVQTEDDMNECQEISQALFGVGRGTTEERMKIVRKNPETYFILRDEDNAIGYFSIMPLKDGKIENILGQTIPVRVETEDIEEFKKGSKVDIYLTAMGVHPKFGKLEKRMYGSRLVSGLIELIINLGKRGIIISSIAARSNMPDGIRLMKHMGFTEVKALTPERRTFVIDVDKSGIPFILQYKQALADSNKNAVSEARKEKDSKRKRSVSSAS